MQLVLAFEHHSLCYSTTSGFCEDDEEEYHGEEIRIPQKRNKILSVEPLPVIDPTARNTTICSMICALQVLYFYGTKHSSFKHSAAVHIQL